MNYPAWQIKTADPAAEQALAGAGCGALLRRVLAARGCTCLLYTSPSPRD